jgi:hypothetical protein
MNARYAEGELIDVQIKGARVGAINDSGMLVQLSDLIQVDLPLPLPNNGVTVTRVAPAEWPPLAGDLWANANGVKVFAQDHMLHTSNGFQFGSAEEALESIGPMTLVYREGWTPAPAADVDQADDQPTPQTEGRAAVVAGFRQLADLIERTDLPIPDLWHLGQSAGWATFIGDSFVPRYTSTDEAVDRLRAWAEECGVEHRTRDVGADVYHNVDVRLGGVSVELSYIVTAAATPEVAAAVADGPAATPTFELGPVLDHDLDGPVELEHEHTGGAAGSPGENEAWCACGVTYAGFDTHAEAMAMLEAHIAEAGRDRDPAVESDADGDLIDGALVALAGALDADPGLLADVHYMAGGTKGDPGECAAWCACGVTYSGFDTLGEASDHVEQHVANVEAAADEPCDRTDLPEDGDMMCGGCGERAGDHPAWRRRHGRQLTPAVESDPDALDQLGVAMTGADDVPERAS